ncbi:hypothetical protein IL38_07510 [Actinopolyspora erythraea]|uniref:Uncharacterized protein n=1 Tax=Actinopolyspora erythraea TaxID=414996 RepID=A0ABR4X640_9ACTN|nr:hypothetical protein [Actinopolyspora erythraea]KGI82139.1 hypothetical protein IL38_07510 [Actinopolyspora erythraea]
MLALVVESLRRWLRDDARADRAADDGLGAGSEAEVPDESGSREPEGSHAPMPPWRAPRGRDEVWDGSSGRHPLMR